MLGSFFSLTVYSQTMYEKYNSYSNRYEYFDTYGNMIGHKTYDKYNDRWVYYKKQQVDNDLHLTETTKAIGDVQSQMQARYTYNYTRLTNSIDALIDKVKTSSYSAYVKKNCLDDFAEKCLKPLNAKKLNMTSTSDITGAIDWLNECMDSFIDFYVEQENKPENTITDNYTPNTVKVTESSAVDVSKLNFYKNFGVVVQNKIENGKTYLKTTFPNSIPHENRTYLSNKNGEKYGYTYCPQINNKTFKTYYVYDLNNTPQFEFDKYPNGNTYLTDVSGKYIGYITPNGVFVEPSEN